MMSVRCVRQFNIKFNLFMLISLYSVVWSLVCLIYYYNIYSIDIFNIGTIYNIYIGRFNIATTIHITNIHTHNTLIHIYLLLPLVTKLNFTLHKRYLDLFSYLFNLRYLS